MSDLTYREGCLGLAVSDFVPYLYYNNPAKEMRGFMKEVLDILLGGLGYCYYFIPETEEGAGQRDENGTWGGVMGLVHRGIANMSATGLSLSPERLEDMDVSEYLYLDEMSAAFKRPVLQSDIAGFLKPYSLLMWMFVLVATAGVLVAICLVHLAYNRVTQDHSSGDETYLPVSEAMQASAAWTLSALLAQSVASPLRGGDSVRLVTGVWLLASLIVATVYRSNLKAMLILPKLELPFNNLEELVETNLPVWVRLGSTAEQAIKNADANTTLGKLRKQMYHGDRFQSVTRLESGEHVLAIPRASLHKLLHNSFAKTGKCNTYVMSGGFMQTTTLSFVIQKGSPLKQQMDPIIRRLRESGLLDYAYHRAIANSTECLKEIRVKPSDNSRVLVLGDFYGVFLVYAAGIAMASLTFLAEVLVHIFK